MRHKGFGFIALAIFFAACGKSDSAATSDTPTTQNAQADTPQANASIEPLPGTGSGAPVAVADIEKWQRGMAAELVAVQQAGEKFKASKNAADSLDNMTATQEMSTLKAGAAAAGLDPERYKFVRSTLSQVALALSPLELDMDPKVMPPGFADQLKAQGAQNLERMKADAPTEVVEAMRPRALQLRKQHTDLVAARLKAAGMTQ
jgi:hypothetical protein